MSAPSSEGELTPLRIDSEVMGRVQPWNVVHRGLEYEGEVVVAETADPKWGRPLEGGVCFRIVLFTVPRRIPTRLIRDPRIAMAVPRTSLGPVRQSLSQEIRSVHEARQRYVARRDTGSVSLRSYMDEREATLLGELVTREAHTYAEGRIYSQRGMTLQPLDIFAGGSTSSWVERLVGAVFEEAYPQLPFRHDQLPSTLNTDQVEAVFRGILQGDGGFTEPAAGFGPALGISSPEAPAVFEGGRCALLDSIGRELESHGGEMPAGDMLDWLCQSHGLNLAVASLYLLAWVRHNQAEAGLAQGHSVQLRAGGPLLSDRLSWDLVHDIEFEVSISGQLDVVRSRPSLDWGTVLPYASLLVEGLHVSQDPLDIADQERRLLEALDGLGQRLAHSADTLRILASSLQEIAASTTADIGRLRDLCSASEYRGFYTAALDRFGGPGKLQRALELYRRAERLAVLAPKITRERLYLDEMTFGLRHSELAVERSSLVGRMGMDSLIGDPSLWRNVEESCTRLRRDYRSAYLSHHAGYHDGAAELLSVLERLRPQIEALERFNEVPELGGPVGEDVSGRFYPLLSAIRTCGIMQDALRLEDAPSCDECQLPMDEDIPRRDVTSLVRDAENAMSVYNRRLSSEGVRRVLDHPTREQLDRFINLVQVSDLTALANVLEDEVVDFLRHLVHRG